MTYGGLHCPAHNSLGMRWMMLYRRQSGKNENRREIPDARDRRQRRKRLLWHLRKSVS